MSEKDFDGLLASTERKDCRNARANCCLHWAVGGSKRLESKPPVSWSKMHRFAAANSNGAGPPVGVPALRRYGYVSVETRQGITPSPQANKELAKSGGANGITYVLVGIEIFTGLCCYCPQPCCFSMGSASI
jgi:hypothetical protein